MRNLFCVIYQEAPLAFSKLNSLTFLKYEIHVKTRDQYVYL